MPLGSPECHISLRCLLFASVGHGQLYGTRLRSKQDVPLNETSHTFLGRGEGKGGGRLIRFAGKPLTTQPNAVMHIHCTRNWGGCKKHITPSKLHGTYLALVQMRLLMLQSERTETCTITTKETHAIGHNCITHMHSACHGCAQHTHEQVVPTIPYITQSSS